MYRSELLVKVVNTQDMTRVLYIRDLPKPPKHLSFDPSGTNLAISGSDGIVYVYSLSSEQPQLLRKIDGLIRRLETDAEASSKVAWHPDGRAFAAPTATRGMRPHTAGGFDSQHQTFRSCQEVTGSGSELLKAGIPQILPHLLGPQMARS